MPSPALSTTAASSTVSLPFLSVSAVSPPAMVIPVIVTVPAVVTVIPSSLRRTVTRLAPGPLRTTSEWMSSDDLSAISPCTSLANETVSPSEASFSAFRKEPSPESSVLLTVWVAAKAGAAAQTPRRSNAQRRIDIVITVRTAYHSRMQRSPPGLARHAGVGGGARLLDVLQDRLDFLHQTVPVPVHGREAELVVRRQPEAALAALDQSDELIDLDRRIGMKSERDHPAAQHGAHDHACLQHAAQIHDAQKAVDQRRNRPIALAQLGGEVVQLGRAAHGGEAAIEHQALMLVGDVAVGDVRRETELDLGLHLDVAPLAAQLLHRLFHHLRVELEADRGDVARLLLAEQVAGAANLEIVRRQPKSAAQVVELLQHAQPLLRVLGDHVLAGNHQIRVGALVRAADPTAQLVE